jgi:hypothetical protein
MREIVNLDLQLHQHEPGNPLHKRHISHCCRLTTTNMAPDHSFAIVV